MNDNSITIVDAAERLSNRSYTDGEDSIAEWHSVYTCPLCSKQVAFSAEDFGEHAFLEESNLSEVDAQAIGVASQAYSDATYLRFKPISADFLDTTPSTVLHFKLEFALRLFP